MRDLECDSDVYGWVLFKTAQTNVRADAHQLLLQATSVHCGVLMACRTQSVHADRRLAEPSVAAKLKHCIVGFTHAHGLLRSYRSHEGQSLLSS